MLHAYPFYLLTQWCDLTVFVYWLMTFCCLGMYSSLLKIHLLAMNLSGCSNRGVGIFSKDYGIVAVPNDKGLHSLVSAISIASTDCLAIYLSNWKAYRPNYEAAVLYKSSYHWDSIATILPYDEPYNNWHEIGQLHRAQCGCACLICVPPEDSHVQLYPQQSALGHLRVSAKKNARSWIPGHDVAISMSFLVGTPLIM